METVLTTVIFILFILFCNQLLKIWKQQNEDSLKEK